MLVLGCGVGAKRSWWEVSNGGLGVGRACKVGSGGTEPGRVEEGVGSGVEREGEGGLG